MSWLVVLAWGSVVLGFITAGIIAADIMAHPQRMPIMSVVWAVTGLYTPLAGLWFYRSMGRPTAAHAAPMKGEWPYWKRVFLSATHCGSGCVLGDIIGAPIVFAFGLTVLGSTLFADYAVEFALAYIFGIAFQYFPIRAMRHLPPQQAIKDAVKADTLALISLPSRSGCSAGWRSSIICRGTNIRGRIPWCSGS